MKKTTVNRLHLKGFTAALMSMLLCGSLTPGASASSSTDMWRQNNNIYRYNSAVLRITNGGNDTNDWNTIAGGLGNNTGVMSNKELDIINSSSGLISFEADSEGIKSENKITSNFVVYANFSIYTKSETWYSCDVDVVKKPLISVQELLQAANVPASEKVEAVVVNEQKSFDMLWLDKKSSNNSLIYYKNLNDVVSAQDPRYIQYGSNSLYNTNYIKGVRVVDTSENGWVKADKIRCKNGESDVCRFYVTKKNEVKTASCTINGIRYKFGANGIGKKYTGWTKSAKGISRYWENGKTVTGWVNVGDNWYYIDKSKGRLTGTHTIDGLEYTFSKKGVWDGKVSGKAVNVENIWTKIYYKMNKKSYGGVYIKDGMIVVLSVDGKAEKAAEKLLSDTGGIVFKKAEYSIYEMEKIKEYIRKNHKRDWSEMYIDHTANRLMLGATKQQLERLQPYLNTLKNRECIVLLDTTGDISYDD